MYSNRLLILLALLFCFIRGVFAEESLKVEQGVLDLRGKNLQQLNEVKLSGNWEFYWGKLLEPSDFTNGNVYGVRYIHVPSLWNSYEINGAKLPAKGAVTYRTLVLFDSVPPILAMQVGGIGTAFNLFVDGNLQCKAGKVSLDEKKAEAGYKPQVVVFTPTNDTVEIIFQVSNYHYAKAGLWLNDYSIGTVDYITNKWNRGIQLSLLLIGCILIFALYHLGLYILNRSFNYTLHYSLFSFVIVARMLAIDDIYLLKILPTFPWMWLIKIDYLSLTLGTLTFSLFIHKFYRELSSKKLFYFIVSYSSLFSAVIILFPPAFFTQFLWVFQFGILIAVFFISIVVLKALQLKRQSAMVFLIGFIIFVFCIINDILYVNRLIFTFYLTSIGFLAFVFSQTYMLSVRFSGLLDKAESMAKNLEETNQNLEYIAEQRTEKIYNQNRLLREQRMNIVQSTSELEKQNRKIINQHEILKHKNDLDIKQNQQITSSIEYAGKIQEAILDTENLYKIIAPNGFVFFKPKEIVSGDFYWFTKIEQNNQKLKVVAVVDCVGHGVPGAFMSILGTMVLNKITIDITTKASDLLDRLQRELKNLLMEQHRTSVLKEGLSVSVCIINQTTMKIQYAGARNPIIIIHKTKGRKAAEIVEYKGDIKPIGDFNADIKLFNNYLIDVAKGDLIYLFTDGYYNQIGGFENEKMNKNRFKKILLNNAHLEMDRQKAELESAFVNWQSNFEQGDDITIIGLMV